MRSCAIPAMDLTSRSTYFGPVLLALFVSSPAWGDMTNSTYVVAKPSDYSYISFVAPSTNSQGDLVVRGSLTSSTAQFRTFLASGQTYTSVLVRTGNIMSPFPAIADNRSVAGFNFVQEFGVVQRFDYSSGAFTATSIGPEDTLGPSANNPFTFIDPVVALDANGTTYFIGQTTGISNGIFGSSTKLSSVSAATNALLPDTDKMSNITTYLDANAGSVVFFGTGSNGTGVYKAGSGGVQAVATVGSAYSAIGARPSVNSNNVVGFEAVSSLGPRVYLQFPNNGSPIPASSVGAIPATIDASSKIAINQFNQVAYIGTDQAGRQAIFSTNLGATREIIATGDDLTPGDDTTKVQSLQIFSGIMKSGQLAFLATTPQGQEIVRMNRGYNQTGRVNDTPVAVPWASTNYLLRSVAPSSIPSYYQLNPVNNPTIAAVGCNLSTTANVLSYFNNDITPLDLQQWLLNKWNASGSRSAKLHYIDPNNDFSDSILTEVTQERFNAGLTDTIVSFAGVNNPSTQSNLQAMISSVRNGTPVKLRVPSVSSTGTYQSYGHYIMVYGLSDPTKANGSITEQDLLVHDPGHGGVYTLQDYDTKFNLTSRDAAWLSEAGRVYQYTATRGVGPVPSAVTISTYSPVDAVLIDPLGHRLGASFNEISGGSYYVEPSYYSLDEESTDTERVWALDDSVKRFLLQGALQGQYTLQLTGTGSGPYDVLLSGVGGLATDASEFTGTITPGQIVTYNFSATSVPEPAVSAVFSGLLLACLRRNRH